MASSLFPGLPLRSLLSLDGGTGNVSLISLRPPLITAHHFVSTINDRAREVGPRSAKPHRCPSYKGNALSRSPRSDHDLRCDRITEYQQGCSKTADFESITVTTHTGATGGGEIAGKLTGKGRHDRAACVDMCGGGKLRSSCC